MHHCYTALKRVPEKQSSQKSSAWIDLLIDGLIYASSPSPRCIMGWGCFPVARPCSSSCRCFVKRNLGTLDDQRFRHSSSHRASWQRVRVVSCALLLLSSVVCCCACCSVAAALVLVVFLPWVTSFQATTDQALEVKYVDPQLEPSNDESKQETCFGLIVAQTSVRTTGFGATQVAANNAHARARLPNIWMKTAGLFDVYLTVHLRF